MGFPEVTVDEWLDGHWGDPMPTEGTYLLVPKEQMERVWWCGMLRRIEEDGLCYASRKPDPEEYGCGWRYLVPVPKEGAE